MTRKKAVQAVAALLLLGLTQMAGCTEYNDHRNGPHQGPPPREGFDGGKPPEPPAEAFAACKNKQDGDVVEVTDPQGKTIKATCRKFDERLAAVPEEMKERRPPGK